MRGEARRGREISITDSQTDGRRGYYFSIRSTDYITRDCSTLSLSLSSSLFLLFLLSLSRSLSVALRALNADKFQAVRDNNSMEKKMEKKKKRKGKKRKAFPRRRGNRVVIGVGE